MLGVGLRAKHFPYLAKHKANVDFFEVLSENYIDTEGYPREVVRRLRRDYKMCMHGVSLSMGSATGVNNAYLKKLKQLADEIEPFLISDHLCFTGVKRENSHDLLPLPFTMRMVDIVVRNIDTVQNFLKTRIALENVSSYLTWRASEMSEWDFINTIVQKSGCKILLDINNVYVNAKNHGYNADDFLTRINPTHVGEIHIAGYSDMGTHLFDTHAEPVHAPVLELWKKHAARFHKIPMIVERDDAIPAFHVVEREVLRLGKIRENAYIKERKNRIVMEVFLPPRVPEKRNNADVGKLQKVFLEGIQNQNFASLAQVKGGGKLSDKAALKVYHAGYTARLTSALGTTYETVWSVLGDRLFFKTCKEYIASHKSISYNLNNYGATFPAFLRGKFKQFTFLGDLAAFELAFQQLFNTAPVVPSVLNFQSIHPERTQFQFFETASLWSFTHRLYPLWRNRAKIPHGYIPRNFATAEFILMYKRHGEILIELLTENQYKIAKALLKKKSLNRVLNTSKAKPKEVERLFQVLSNGGVVSKIR